jgi:hypothetical protein
MSRDPMSAKLGMERCTACGHRWIDYEGARGKCYLCESTAVSECISLREIRDAIQVLRKEDKKYLDKHAKRTVILKQRYREVAELSLQRAQEIFTKVRDHYTKGNLSDKVIDQLIVAFRLFSELGIHQSATAVAYMTAMGYAQRGIGKEIRSMDDLNDLVAARQWFLRLGSPEWEAAVNLHIGEKAMATISTDTELLQLMTQVSLWHFYRARDYYYEKHLPDMVERIQFDIARTTELLTSYARGQSDLEAARISARSGIQQSEQIRKGLESLGQSVQYGLTALGEHIEQWGGSLSRAMQASSQSLGSNIAGAMYTLAGSSKLRGRSLDRRMSDVGQLISTSAREASGENFKQVQELGSRFAPGAGGGHSPAELTNDPSVVRLSEGIAPEIARSQEGLKHLDEPSIRLTGTLLDTLVAKGLGKVVEQLETSEQTRTKQ